MKITTNNLNNPPHFFFMEELIIVDEEDNVIGYKKRGTLSQEDIYRVAALWIESFDGKKVLLAKRALTKKKDPSLWGPAVAGTIEKGESYESNMIKETQEEIGLADISFKKFIKQRSIFPHNHFVQWFVFKIDKPLDFFNFNREEVAEIKWFTKKELFKLVEKDSKELIESLKYFIKKLL